MSRITMKADAKELELLSPEDMFEFIVELLEREIGDVKMQVYYDLAQGYYVLKISRGDKELKLGVDTQEHADEMVSRLKRRYK